MEAEFGVILNRDIKPELASFDYILKSIGGIYPLIEIHNLVFYGEEPFGSELLANNAIHAGIILGRENPYEITKVFHIEINISGQETQCNVISQYFIANNILGEETL